MITVLVWSCDGQKIRSALLYDISRRDVHETRRERINAYYVQEAVQTDSAALELRAILSVQNYSGILRVMLLEKQQMQFVALEAVSKSVKISA